MRLEFTQSQYLGHKNLKDALENITKIGNNRAITSPVMDGDDDTAKTFDCTAFEYNINGTNYVGAAASIELDITNQSITLTATKYAVIAVLIDADGAITMVKGDEAATKSLAIVAMTSMAIPSTAAIMGFLMLGDGTNSWVAGSDLVTIGSMFDFYNIGNVGVTAGLSADGQSLIPAI